MYSGQLCSINVRKSYDLFIPILIPFSIDSAILRREVLIIQSSFTLLLFNKLNWFCARTSCDSWVM